MAEIKFTCARIFKDQNDLESIRRLQELIQSSSPATVRMVEHIVFSVFFPILKSISTDSNSFKEKHRQQIVDTLKSLFEKIKIEKLPLFFNIYGFLLFEIYDCKSHTVLKISEEFKLSIMQCMTELAKSVDYSLVQQLYTKENSLKLCQMMYVALELAKSEEFKSLRIAAIECIMAIARVLNDDDFNDIVLRNHVAEALLFFLPGVSSQLKNVALIDEKYGHKVPSVALKAWGRIVALLMQNYESNIEENALGVNTVSGKWKDEHEFREYLQSAKRSTEWYRESDKKLQQLVIELSKLTHHSHPTVRLELLKMCALLIENCTVTMPSSVIHIIEIVIVLSEDSVLSQQSRTILDCMSEKLTKEEFKCLFDNLEESFYNLVASIPRKFNAIDERVQIVALNSLIGYIGLFGQYNLARVLHSPVHLNKLILTLIHISEFENNISILEEYTTLDFDVQHELTWKQFRYFKDNTVVEKIQTVCWWLGKLETSAIVSDFLLDVINTDDEQRKQAIFVLNSVMQGSAFNEKTSYIFKNVINTYTDLNTWFLPLSTTEDTLVQIQSNVIQICLLVEGIGKISSSVGENFQQFLLNTLYLVLERAGSPHPIIRSVGLQALSNISKACGYSSITHLIHKNSDYFFFYIERRLKTQGGLEVLSVVIQYGNLEMLNSTCEIMSGLLLRLSDCSQINLNAYLQVFKMFILGLHKWFSLDLKEDGFKTRKEKLDNVEDFQVSNIEPVDRFSDDIMGKTAEELYSEDLEKSQKELEEEIYDSPEKAYKKVEPPTHIKVTAAIFTKILHYLPSKNETTKLLVLAILKTGLSLLKDWENEMLPLVHLIWSPLVDRFKEHNPVIINYSFQLLVVLAKLSKEFIRSRTLKDVLPHILETIQRLSQESFLKDKGSAYRYSQNYKLQLVVLEHLGNIIIDLDLSCEDFHKAMDCVFVYLSDKQPIPLQKLALLFFQIVARYDPELSEGKVAALKKNASAEYDKHLSAL